MSSSNDPSGWGPAPEPGGAPPPPPPPSQDAWGAPPPPPPPPPQAGWGEQQSPGWSQPPQQGWGNQYGGAYGAPAQTENTAIVALVLACASFVICPVIPAVIALALVPSSRTKIQQSVGRLTGEGLLTATKIIAWLNIGLLALAFLGFMFLVVVGSMSSSTGY